MILLHDQCFMLPLHQEWLKASSCSKENHFTAGTLRDAWIPGDGDGFLRPRGAATLWPEKQTVSGAFSITVPRKDDFIFQVHMAVLMSSVSKPAVAVSFCQINNPAVPPILAAQFMLQLSPSCTVGAKLHSQPCYSKSLSGPDLPIPSFHAGRVSGHVPG